MTKFLSKVFLSGILLSSISGYCSNTLNIEQGFTTDDGTTSGANLSVTDDKSVDYNINVGDANFSGTINEEERAKITLANGKTLTLNKNDGGTNSEQTIRCYKLGQISGPTGTEENSSINLNGEKHSIVFHPGSKVDGNVTITSQPIGTDHTGIVDLSNYITNNSDNLSFSSGNTDEQKLSLTLNNVQVKLFNSGINKTSIESLFSNLNNTVFAYINTDASVTLLGVSDGDPQVQNYNSTTGEVSEAPSTYNSDTTYSSEFCVISKPSGLSNKDKLFNGGFTPETTSSVSIRNILGNSKVSSIINYDSFSETTSIDDLLTDYSGNAALFTNTYSIAFGANDVTKDFSKIRTNTINEGENSNSKNVTISNVKDYIKHVTQYNPAKDGISRTFTLSNIDFNGSGKTTNTLTLGDSDNTNGTSTTTLNLTGTHTVTATLSINDGSTINLKPGSTLTLGASS